jgi:hypothetical protein
MTFNKMANLISGGIDYICFESDNEEELKEVQEAEYKLYELTNLLETYGVDDIEALKNVFKTLNCQDNLNELICETKSENLFGEDLLDDKGLYTNGFRF